MGLLEQSVSLNEKPNISYIDKTVLFLYSIYFILNPFYLWRSGLPQIADFVLLFSLVVYVLNSRLKFTIKKKNKKILFFGLMFVLWIILVNSIWTIILQEAIFFPTVFYIYNFLIFSYSITLYDKYGATLLKTIYISILLSLAIQLVIYLSQGGFTGGRQTVGFNNPNQLGYYALLMISFLMFISSRISIKVKSLLIGISIAMFFVFSSLSKAAIVSAIGLVGVYIFANNSNHKMKKKILIVSIFLFVITGVLYNTTNLIQDSPLITSVQGRIDSIGSDSDDSLDTRGYYRIYAYPEYWMFGAGEGVYTRFRHRSIEFHSTLGNIQVSYGIIGTLLFTSIMIIALKKDRFKSWYILLFLMSYGLTHNGIRNSLLWIFLGLLATSDKKIEKELLM